MAQEDLSLTITRKSCNICRKDYYASLGACPECGADLIEVKRDPFIGKKLADRYQVECLVGVGGMGVVYKAWHEALRREVAIKVLRQQFINDPTSVKRFQQEAIAASRLNHPHIISLHDFGSTEDGFLYMVMDLLDGRSLAQEQKEKKMLGVDRTIRIITQVCEALEHAHKKGIVHRDLKPGNIMLMRTEDNPDFVKLVDFGIAKVMVKEEDQELTQKGEVFGSPLYMSPEQCLGMDLDGRSDIYALGAVIYEALVGEVPHLGKNMIETIDKQIHRPPEPFKARRPDIYIPERLESVVLRALSKNPDDRQQTMKALADELHAAVPKPTQALALRTSADAAKGRAQTPAAVIGAIVGTLVLVGAGFALFRIMQSKTPPPAPPPVVRNTAKPALPANTAATVQPSVDGAGTNTGSGSTGGTPTQSSAQTPEPEPVFKKPPVEPAAVAPSPLVRHRPLPQPKQSLRTVKRTPPKIVRTVKQQPVVKPVAKSHGNAAPGDRWDLLRKLDK